MPNVGTDVGAIAKAWQSTVDLIKKMFETSETRKLKSAARVMQSYIRRAEREFPEIKKDRTLNKYKEKFEELII